MGLPKEPFPIRPRKDEATLRGSNDARSFNRQNSKTASQNVRKSNQTCSLSQILPHLRLLLKKTKQAKEQEKLNGLIAVYYELISQEIGSDGKEFRKSILSLDYCLEIYLGYKTDFVPGSALTKGDKVSFQDCLQYDRYGLPVYIVNTQFQTNKFVVLRPDDIDLTEIFHKLITSSVSKAESEKQLTSDILRIILDTSAAHEAAVAGLRVYIVRKERQLDVFNVASLKVCNLVIIVLCFRGHFLKQKRPFPQCRRVCKDLIFLGRDRL